MTEKAILYDATACIACRGCQIACKQWNDNPVEDEGKWGNYPEQADITHSTWMKIMLNEAESSDNGTLLFARRACMHCTDAACIEVCPTGALSRHELGFVTYNKDACSGCGYCTEFCPFGAIKMDNNYEIAAYKRDGDEFLWDLERLMKPLEHHAEIHPTAYEAEQAELERKVARRKKK